MEFQWCFRERACWLKFNPEENRKINEAFWKGEETCDLGGCIVYLFSTDSFHSVKKCGKIKLVNPICVIGVIKKEPIELV